MARTPTPQEKIEALRLARPIIETGEQAWICYALHDVARGSKRLAPACDALDRHIERALEQGNQDRSNDPIPTLTFWIRRHRPGLPDDSESLREYRLRWIDWMIAQLERRLNTVN